MKNQLPLLTATTLLLASPLAFAQQTGTSHPETLDDTITVAKQAPAVAKPSPVTPMPAPALQPRAASPAADSGAAMSDAPATETTLAARPQPAAVSTADDDNVGIVTEVPSAANELPEGTLVRVKLSQEISTRETQPDIRFSAFLSAPLLKHGHVAVPAGAVLTGRITELSGGHHIGKAAGIHLQPEFITLPDGTHYKCVGQVIDLFSDHRTHVNREGTITGNDPTYGTAATVGAATGTGAIAGAVLGGGVGALVGAGIGAGISGAVWANQETSSTLRAGTEIIFSLNEPMLLKGTTITAE